ncbi:MAG: hypothetical protein HXX15_21320 [Rhodopseudomonas sp.]|uniref:hypothetical protein n=1 Tax=Rhodopseudomonas sp. TaxID=1078 RepID=UPI0017D6252D|nr:hypothetical protein [Rhodopseudomonas sp.]NVN88628.1 hypothetical protein [Rhodopseudomonas sp.]
MQAALYYGVAMRVRARPVRVVPGKGGAAVPVACGKYWYCIECIAPASVLHESVAIGVTVNESGLFGTISV